jgi:RHS repeat-associated protein
VVGGSLVVVVAGGSGIFDGGPDLEPPSPAVAHVVDVRDADDDDARVVAAGSGGSEWLGQVVTGDAKESDAGVVKRTPTMKVVANGDGTKTAELSSLPVRFKDERGRWRELDGTPVELPGDRVGPKQAMVELSIATSANDTSPRGPVLGRQAPTGNGAEPDDPLVLMESDAGVFGLSHPHAANVEGALDGQDVVFEDALSGGRDLVETMLPRGVEESVILPDAAAPGSYVVVLTRPDDTVVREGVAGVEFVRDGDVVGAYSGGLAFDANPALYGREQPVTVRLVRVREREVEVEVSVDPVWLTDPGRVFPVTIDPVFTTYPTITNSGDTSVNSANPGQNLWNYPEIRSGASCGWGCVWSVSDVLFNLDGVFADARHWPTTSTLSMVNTWSPSCWPTQTDIRALAGWYGPYANWYNQMPFYTTPVTGTVFSYGNACIGAGFVNWDVSQIVKYWRWGPGPYGISNQGFDVHASNYYDSNSWKTFASAESWLSPTLTVNYQTLAASYTSRLAGGSPGWQRVEGRTGQVPVTVTNTAGAGDVTWTKAGGFGVSCKIKKPSDPAFNADCPVTYLADGVSVAPGESVKVNALIPPLVPGDYTIKWDMWRDDAGYFSQHGSSPSGGDALTVHAAVPYARGEHAYSEFVGSVNLATGQYFDSVTDVSLAGAGPAVELTRSYNSGDPRHGLFGQGWASTWDLKTTTDANGDVTIVYPDGRLEQYVKAFDANDNVSYAPPYGYYSKLEPLAGGALQLTDLDGQVFAFAAPNGQSVSHLTQVADPYGLTLSLDYGDDDELDSVENNTSHRSLAFTWGGASGNRHVTTVKTNPLTVGDDSTRLTWTYDYSTDPDPVLEEVCDPEFGVGGSPQCEQYTYEATPDAGSSLPARRMTQVTRARGNTGAQITYKEGADHANRAVKVENGVDQEWGFAYATENGATEAELLNLVTVTDPRQGVEVTKFNRARHLVSRTDQNTKVRTLSYDKRGMLVSETENGITTLNEVDDKGNVTKHTDGNLKVSYFHYNDKNQVDQARDARSANATDNAYLTVNTYDATGKRLVQTQPPSPAGPKKWDYTDGTEPAVGGGTTPAGLLEVEESPATTWTVGTPVYESTQYAYDSTGDLVTVTAPSGLQTSYVYDTLGRRKTETVISDTFPDPGVTTNYAYNKLSLVTEVTEAPVTNPITSEVHRRHTTTTYDANRNTTEVTTIDIGGSANPDPPRSTVHDFDDADRENAVHYLPETQGGVMTREFDPNGNVSAVIDPEGRRIETTYTPTDLPLEVTLKGYVDPVNPGDPVDIALQRFGYDNGGRKTSETDALDRQKIFEYDNEDRVIKIMLVAPGETNVVLESTIYDPAGNPTTQKTGNDTRMVTTTYLPSGWKDIVTLDPANLNRVTDYDYDAAGRVTKTTQKQGATALRATVDEFDPTSGFLKKTTIENGAQPVTTQYTRDQRGLPVQTADPNGAVTTRTFDELGREVSVVAPAVSIDLGANAQPTTTKGYNTNGDVTHARDARDAVTTTAYDQFGRRSQITHPTYTPPGGTAVAPTETFGYDKAGNLTQQVDRLGQPTDYVFDMLNRVARKTEPAPSLGAGRPTTTYQYDAVGNARFVTDANGIVTTTTYDGRNRAKTRNVDGVTVTLGYDQLNNKTSESYPTSPTTTYASTYNLAGERTRDTDPAAKNTDYTYDGLGQLTKVKTPTGKATHEYVYDNAGRKTQDRRLAANGALLDTAFATYDAAGNQLSTTDRRGFLTTLTYDALGRLTTVAVPGAGTTTYGYDANANLTRVVDGRSQTTTLTYNPWNLRERTTEPATTAHPAEADRQWTLAYNAAGQAVQEAQPGGVTVARTYDLLGRETQTAGSGGGAPAATKTFGYDPGGRLTTISHPAGTQRLTYNARGLLTTSGPDGASATATFGYDYAGRMNTRTDASAATATTFTYGNARDVTQVNDALTGQRTYTWNDDRQLANVTYGTGGSAPTRALNYDDRGRLDTDTLTAGATTRYKTDYDYDNDDNVTRQEITPAGVAGTGAHTYTYDNAGRLASWTPPGQSQVVYTYDNAGNRTQAGATTYTYDERNRLTAATNGSSWTWTPRGTLATATTTSGTTDFAYDALGRQTASGATTYTYDALDRVATRDTAAFSYAGKEIDPVAIDTWRITHSPGGDPLSLDDTATPTPTAEHILRNRHGDLVALFGTTGIPTDTTSYTPYGEEAADTGTLEPPLGYQSDYTDPATNQVWMGARWYQPSADTFSSRDTVTGMLKTPVSLNRYTYANDDPLQYFDPDGRASKSTLKAIAAWQQSLKFRSFLYHLAIAGALAAKRAAGPNSTPGKNPIVSTYPGLQVSIQPFKYGYESIYRNEYGIVVSSTRTYTTGCKANNGSTPSPQVVGGCRGNRYRNPVTIEQTSDWRKESGTRIDRALDRYLNACSPANPAACLGARSLLRGESLHTAAHACKGCDRGVILPDATAQFLIDTLVTFGVGAATAKLLTRGVFSAGAASIADAGAAGRTGWGLGVATDDLAGAASRATQAVGAGRGPVYGTKVHTAFASEVRQLEAAGAQYYSEVTYLGGRVREYGTSGSVRLDAVVGPKEAPIAIFDLKTGSAALNARRVEQIRSNLPVGYQDIPILEVRP